VLGPAEKKRGRKQGRGFAFKFASGRAKLLGEKSVRVNINGLVSCQEKEKERRGALARKPWLALWDAKTRRSK